MYGKRLSHYLNNRDLYEATSLHALRALIVVTSLAIGYTISLVTWYRCLSRGTTCKPSDQISGTCMLKLYAEQMYSLSFAYCRTSWPPGGLSAASYTKGACKVWHAIIRLDILRSEGQFWQGLVNECKAALQIGRAHV